MEGYTDFSFYFNLDHIKFNRQEFEYTTGLGKQYKESLRKQTQWSIDSIANCHLNKLESFLFSFILDENHFVGINHKDCFLDNNHLCYLLDFYDDEEYILNYLNDIIDDHYIECDGNDHNWKMLLDFLQRYLDWRINYTEKIDSVVDSYGTVDHKYNDFIWETIFYELDYPVFNLINDDNIFNAIRDVTYYIYESLLSKKDYDKMKILERKNIKEGVLVSNKIQDLWANGLVTAFKNSNGKINLDKNDRKKRCYIMKDSVNNLYKIGNSVDPKLRERTLQSEKPFISIVKTFKQNHEKELHKKYNEFRRRGEWFELTDIQLKYICTHYE